MTETTYSPADFLSNRKVHLGIRSGLDEQGAFEIGQRVLKSDF